MAGLALGSALRPIAVAGVVGALAVLWLLFRAVRGGRPAVIEDWQQAESLTASWLRSQGCRQVALTTAGADGGIDVMTQDWAVQVKHTAKRVGRPAVQQIVGAALDADRRPAVVSTSGFTQPAITYAQDHDVALVELGADGHGTLVTESANEIGERRRSLLRRRRH